MTEILCETSNASGPLHFAGKVTASSPQIGGRILPQTLVKSQFTRSCHGHESIHMTTL